MLCRANDAREQCPPEAKTRWTGPPPPGTSLQRIQWAQVPLFRSGPSPPAGHRQRSLVIPHGARCRTEHCP
eukprot:8681996-Alexandrium_andersonii.AAC.1